MRLRREEKCKITLDTAAFFAILVVPPPGVLP